MTRVTSAISVILAMVLVSCSSNRQALIERFDEGPFAGKGFPYSESARAGNLLFLTGQIGTDADGKVVGGGIQGEAEQTMLNIEAALRHRGLSVEHVVKCTVFLTDFSEWGAFNEVYKKHFSKPYPARSAFGVTGLTKNARVEMECIAVYPTS